MPFSSLNFRLRLANQSTPLSLVCFMLFFFALFDGMVTYFIPLIVTQNGLSTTMMGFIIGSSSIFGAIFDFFMSKYLQNTHFRRVYLLMFAIAFLYPLVIWQAKSVWLFLVAMAIWGLYYDLLNFGTFDFVGRTGSEKEHSSYFGRISIFKSLGYMIAPIIAGLTLGASEVVGTKPFFLMLVFLGISALFYLFLSNASKKQTKQYIQTETCKRLNLLTELHLWKKIGSKLFPVLVLSCFFNIYDSFFWTLGPLLAESYEELRPFNGLFMTAYTLPALLVGWFVGDITKHFGKKRTAFISFLLGSLVLSMFFFLHSPILILVDIFLASIFIGLTLPSIHGAYSDYLSESSQIEREIESVSDFFGNIGYVIGPILAGLLSDRIGNPTTFSVLGITCAAMALVLLIVTPRKINLKISIPKSS